MRPVLLSLAPMMMLAACGGASNAAGNNAVASAPAPAVAGNHSAAADRPAPTKASAAAPGRTEALVAQGTQESGPSYTSVRAAALAEGWQPAPTSDSDCRGQGVIGYVGANGDQPRNFCEVLPEIESCTSNGLCLMRFRQPADGRILEITTYGDYSDWGGPDQDQALYVQGGRINGNDIAPADAR